MLVLKPAAGLGERLDSLAFAPDGRALAAPVRGKGVLLWTTFAPNARAELIPKPGGGGDVRIAFAPDGRLFLGNDQLFVIDLGTRKSDQVPTGKWHRVAFAISPDSTKVVVSEYQQSGESTVLTCWPTTDFTAHLWQIDLKSHVYFLPEVAPDGTFIQVESMRQSVSRHWHSHRVRRSFDTGAALYTSPPLSDHPEQLVLSPDGAMVVVRIREHLYTCSVVGEEVKWAHNDSPKHFTGIAYHPSGRYLAATSNDETVKLFDTTTWEIARTFTWDIGRMRSIAFSPDGTLAAAGSDKGKVVVWDVDL